MTNKKEELYMKININKKAVGSRIKQIRMNKGYTLESFGKLFNVSKSNVLKWEQGQSLPNKERLASISKIADMTVNELLFGSIDEFIDNNLASIHEYQTGKDHFSSSEEYNDNRFFLTMWLEERDITLENIHYIYDYIDQNNATWNPWNIDIEYLKTMENIRENMKDNTALFVELVEMLTDKDRAILFNYLISRIKSYQLNESDKKYIDEIEKSYIKK